MTTPHSPGVLIVGAGPTGLTAALALTLSGVHCRIVDRRAEPGSSSRALGLQSRSMEVLAGLGVTDEIERVAYRLRGARMMRGHRPMVDMAWIPPDSRFPHTYVLPQTGVEDILARRLADLGVRVERGVEVVDAAVRAGKVEATLDTGDSIGATWLIGADGARSRVRTSLGIGFPERATGETYYLADANLELPLELGDSAMWLGPEGPLMLMRLPGNDGLWRIFVDVTSHRTPLPPVDASVLTELMDERGPHGTQIRSLRWTSVYHSRLALAEAYRADRVFLAGDAAHVFPPFGGQGMNLGIQDAVNLAWRLAAVEHGADVDLLLGYERERRPVAATVIDDVEARRRLYALRNPVARAMRDVLLTLGGRSRRAARRASLQNSQLSISYRDHTPARTDGTAPHPGDRAPHAPLPTAQTSTHELFGPGQVTLMVFDDDWTGPPVTDQPGVKTVRITASTDPDGVIRDRFGISPGQRGFVLVRPDGHIASRGDDPVDASAAIQAMIGHRQGS